MMGSYATQKIFLTKGLIWKPERAEKIFGEKRIFVCRNKSHPLPALVEKKNTAFEVQQNFTLKIQLKICYIVGETNLEFCSLYFMLFDGRKVFNLPFNRVNWPQEDFRNLSHSPNTGFHLWPNWN